MDVARLDAWLLARPKAVQRTVLAITVAGMIVQALPFVPRDAIDYSRSPWPVVRGIAQPQTLGSDTVADIYEARVTLNDVRDMYTKRLVEQTPLEASFWSRAASAPYPPVALLAEAGLFALGGRSPAGFYLMILALAGVFIALSLTYFIRVRWYLFPILYGNFSYIALRFAGVQDCTYVIMLTLVVVALHLARRRWPMTHVLMALAITVKLSPLFYCVELVRMRRRTAVVFAVIVAAGLALPYLIWDNYLYIYSFGASGKGRESAHLWATVLIGPFSVVLWYIEKRRGFDLEDRLGWSLVPFTLFFAVWTNAARHLLLALLVPDKRGSRNIAAAIGLALHSLFPVAIPIASLVAILIGLLAVVMAGHLRAIGWKTIRTDLRHPVLALRAP